MRGSPERVAVEVLDNIQSKVGQGHKNVSSRVCGKVQGVTGKGIGTHVSYHLQPGKPG